MKITKSIEVEVCDNCQEEIRSPGDLKACDNCNKPMCYRCCTSHSVRVSVASPEARRYASENHPHSYSSYVRMDIMSARFCSECGTNIDGFLKDKGFRKES
jgi:hypothetical protein